MSDSSCSHIPLIDIRHYDYASKIRSRDFHLAPLEDMKSVLPYPHRHNFYHIVWITAGSGHHIIDAARYEVRPNTLFFMAPDQIHDFALSDETTGFAISFSPEFFALRADNRNSSERIPAYDLPGIREVFYMSPDQAAILRDLLDNMAAEYQTEADGSADIIWSYLRIFLIKAARLVGQNDDMHLGSRERLLSRRFRNLLEQHVHTLHDTAGYARMLNVTARSLNDTSRKMFGKTAARMIRERVMLEAKRMLLHSEATVEEVATRLAFDDPAYFSRCFKKHAGCSPIKFRQNFFGKDHGKNGYADPRKRAGHPLHGYS